MDTGFLYRALVLVILVALAVALFVRARRHGAPAPMTWLGGLAIVFVVAGIAFGASRLVGYGLFAVGLALAVLDIARRSRRT